MNDNVFEKQSYQESDREKWGKVLVYEMMSSEESGEDGPTGNSMIVNPLPWRSTRVDNFFQSLDDQAQSEKSHQSLRQKKQCVIAARSSSHPRPVKQLPTWAFSDVDE